VVAAALNTKVAVVVVASAAGLVAAVVVVAVAVAVAVVVMAVVAVVVAAVAAVATKPFRPLRHRFNFWQQARRSPVRVAFVSFLERVKRHSIEQLRSSLIRITVYSRSYDSLSHVRMGEGTRAR